jgi:hypothetical protein
MPIEQAIVNQSNIKITPNPSVRFRYSCRLLLLGAGRPFPRQGMPIAAGRPFPPQGMGHTRVRPFPPQGMGHTRVRPTKVK